MLGKRSTVWSYWGVCMYEYEFHRPAHVFGLFSAVLILPGLSCKFPNFSAHCRSEKEALGPLPFGRKRTKRKITHIFIMLKMLVTGEC